MLPLSLSYDHRAIDGALAARFLAEARDAAPRPAQPAALTEGETWPRSRSRSPTSGTSRTCPVITVLVKAGDTIAKDDPLVELESDKATMEVPSPQAGKVVAVKIKEGDKVAEGTVILTLEAEGAAAAPAARRRAGAPRRGPRQSGGDLHAEVVVLGSGPGGYTAAFRAADLGKKVVLIERDPTPRRRLPQRRLHPVEGAAPRRQGHLRGRGDGPLRREVRQAGGRRRRPARLEGERRRQADRRAHRPRQGAAR